MTTNMKIPLSAIRVKCSECGDDATGEDMNSDRVRYHTANGSIARLPKVGLDPEQVTKLANMTLVCECCHEDRN